MIRLARKIFSNIVEGTRRSKLEKRWIDAVIGLLRARSISDEETGMIFELQWNNFEYEGGGVIGNFSLKQ